MSSIVVAVTGHRPETLLHDNSLWLPAFQLIASRFENYLIGKEGPNAENYVTCELGGARGVDNTCALVCQHLDIAYDLRLPFPGYAFTKYWNDYDKEVFRLVASRAVNVTCETANYCRSGYYLRDKRMVDHCDRLFAVWDGRKTGGTYLTVEYARKIGKPVDVLDPITLLQ